MSYGEQCNKLNSSQNCVVLDLNGFLINQKQFSLLYLLSETGNSFGGGFENAHILVVDI